MRRAEAPRVATGHWPLADPAAALRLYLEN
jgi:hypothetical protein